MQYASLRNDQAKQLQSSLAAGLDANYKNKALKVEEEKAKAAGFDLEKLASKALIDQNMGVALDPQQQAVLKAFDTLETRKLAQGPDGNYRKINASIFGGGGMPISESGATGFDLGNVAPAIPASFAGGTNKIPGKPEDMANIDSIPRLDVSMLQGTGDADMDAYRQTMAAQNESMANNGTPSGFDTGLVAPVETNGMRKPIVAPPELADNPNATQKYMESAASAAGSFDSEVAKAGAVEAAKKDAEISSSKGAKKTATKELIPLIEDMEAEISGGTSGELELKGSQVANYLGYPTDKTKANARMQPKTEVLTTKLKNWIRGPGEGTWTDADQQKLDRLAPKEGDSIPVKAEKLKSLRELMATESGEAPKSEGKKGFKYLGTE